MKRSIANLPIIYAADSGEARKRAKGAVLSGGWVDVTPHGYESRFGTPAYPNINGFSSFLESDNPLDTPALAPLIKIILVKNGDKSDEKIVQPGTVVALGNAATVTSDLNYSNKMCYDLTLNGGHAFVFPEGFTVRVGEVKAVAVAVQDACEVNLNAGAGRSFWSLVGDAVAESALCSATRYLLFVGDQFAFECTYLHAGAASGTHVVCLYPSDHVATTYGVFLHS